MGLQKAAKKLSRNLLWDWYAVPGRWARKYAVRKYKEGAIGRFGSRAFAFGKYVWGEAKGYAKAAAKYSLAAGAAVGYGAYLTGRFAKNVAESAGQLSLTGARAIKSVAVGGVEVAKKEEQVVATALGDVAYGGERVARAVGEGVKQGAIGALKVAQEVEKTAAVGVATGVQAARMATASTGEPMFQPELEIPTQDGTADTKQPDDTEENTLDDSFPPLPAVKLLFQKPILVPI